MSAPLYRSLVETNQTLSSFDYRSQMAFSVYVLR